ncbi:Fic family protein [Caenimonas koreensis]|uniref:Fic family protein n=1 Tax=Caenimonas koreensis TaxID=367474 RepID=UPI0037835E09
MYIWQAPGWPGFHWDTNALTGPLAQARMAQGRMLGMASSLGMVDLGDLQLSGWSQEAIATAQIEGEVLQLNSVRASAARRLGLAHASAAARDPRSEATLDMLQAAIAQWTRPLEQDALFGWQAALFPTGRSGVSRITTGAWRNHAEPMQIVTPRMGLPDIVHYEAPPCADVPAQMQILLEWFNTVSVAHGIDGLVRAAIAHVWFEAIHPFEDGNGRIGRAIAELALAQDMQSSQRLFSLSAQIVKQRAAYYDQLQAVTGQGDLNITSWVQWFVGRIQDACDASTQEMQISIERNRYWAHVHSRNLDLTASQRKALARLLQAEPEGFAGGMSTEKYGHLTSTSRATAYRELTQLIEYGLLTRTGQGRATRYALVLPQGNF